MKRKQLLKAIAEEKWAVREPGRAWDAAYSHNQSLERIAAIVKQQRIMKEWTQTCKPKKPGVYWVKERHKKKVFLQYLTPLEISDFYRNPKQITHWLNVQREDLLLPINAEREDLSLPED